jgi:hypothetical protein
MPFPAKDMVGEIAPREQAPGELFRWPYFGAALDS